MTTIQLDDQALETLQSLLDESATGDGEEAEDEAIEHLRSQVEEDPRPEIRHLDDIQFAHDILMQVVLGEVPFPYDNREEAFPLIRAHLDALCYVLRHEHSSQVNDLMSHVTTFLKERGYAIRDYGDIKADHERNVN